MSGFFDKERHTVSEHISNIYKEKELQRERTIQKFRIVECQKKPVTNYYEI